MLPMRPRELLDAENRITKLLNNYAEISFNFGPTLLSWMKDQAPSVYQAILDADQQSASNAFPDTAPRSRRATTT